MGIRYSKFKICLIILICYINVFSYKTCFATNLEDYNILQTIGTARKMSMHMASLKTFLQTSLKPVGKVMYIYGGGWNTSDTGSGIETVTLGLSGQWINFEEQQDSNYYHKNYNYKVDNSVIHLGLDCSGFVGWTLYNTFQKQNGQVGYVDYASDMGDNLANMGYGTMREINEVVDYQPGDIMTNGGHIWIVLGECLDGSVVFVHSSPPGVQISGTTTPMGGYDSEAIALATKYMKTYFPEWYARYPDSSRNSSYLTTYRQYRWYVEEELIVNNTVEGNHAVDGNMVEENDGNVKSVEGVAQKTFLITDEEGLRNMEAEEVLKILFGE